ncbi:actin-binding LIM protein 1-like isoform X1 [Pecten maximus]|uniref:actin-binding LIM protein 1-like isoform X1 n=1 Tax=Pecten maximus TaxID=6579 RepID=UPI001457E60B|nr:actin-binding LIM protein 1-like isoform X1 [Pecten maximus]
MGAKNAKHRGPEGDTTSYPSPKKSPKRSHRTSRSSSRERTPSPVASRKEARDQDVEVQEEVQQPITARRTETRPERPQSHRASRENGVRESMDVDDHKENVPEIDSQIIVEKMSSSPRTPAKMVNGHDKQSEPFTPLNVNDSRISNHLPQATSTPAPNGILSNMNGPMSPDSDADHTDVSDDEAFTPTDQQFQFNDRSPSSGSLVSQSTVSSSKRSQSDSLDRRSEVNYGRFYTSSYLEKGKQNYMKRASLNPTPKSQLKSPHFHRPANFSYSKEAPDFLKNCKKSGMAQLATSTKVVVKRTRRASSPGDLKNEEAVRMSMFPAAKPPKPNEVTKIEREDWPGPPSPAAILPELMRARRKSRGEVEDDDEEEVIEDPKIQKEIDELSKFKDTSGIGSIIYKELEERRVMPVKALDPWKSSRAPNAKYEPKYVTRYQSPMFASPSRFLDRPRRSWDDTDLRRGYRTISTMANYPVAKPGYGSYSLTPRAATLPLSGVYGGVFYNYNNYHYFDFDDSDVTRHRPSAYTSTSTVNTDHGSRSHISSIHEGPGLSLLTLQRSTWHTEAEPPTYPYEKLKISNFELPKDTDRNMLEIHLVQEDFEDLFNMNKEDFSRLAEWKRNDLKRKVDLF